MLTDAKPIVPAEISKEEISPYWSFNETADISKYEDFDHKKFLGNYENVTISLRTNVLQNLYNIVREVKLIYMLMKVSALTQYEKYNKKRPYTYF